MRREIIEVHERVDGVKDPSEPWETKKSQQNCFRLDKSQEGQEAIGEHRDSGGWNERQGN